MMEMRKMPGTGEEISLLGFGCMRLPRVTQEKQDIDEAQAQKLIDYAMAHGVTYYDTAYPYHEGMSELFIGNALQKYPRESFQLASKMPIWDVKSKEDVARIFEEQLQKCQVEYFDFYLLHAMNEERFAQDREFEIYETLNEYKKQGKIRYLGFSYHDTPDVLEQNIQNHEWDFIQLQINYLDWELQDAKRQYELCERPGIPVVVMEPVRGGALAELSEKAGQVLKEECPDQSIASWAIRYAASLPGVLTVLSGMSDIGQVEDNVRTMEQFQPLSDREHRVLNEAVSIYRSSGTIPCTGCRYCMDCPFGVDIPVLFFSYNQYRLNENAWQFRTSYQALGAEKHPANCTACQQCVKQCPQGIQIPEVLKEVHEAMEEAAEKEQA